MDASPKVKKKKLKKEGDNPKEKKKKNKETFPNYYTPPPVYMSEDEEENENGYHMEDIDMEDPFLRQTDEYKELLRLMKIQQKTRENEKERKSN